MLASYLAEQYDYLVFLYGISLISLAAVAWSLSSYHLGTLRWDWLGAFGLTHGIGSGLMLVTNAYPAIPTLSLLTSMLFILGYASLFEFGRTGISRYYRPVPVSIYLLAALLLALGALGGKSGFEAAACYSLGLPAAVASACTFAAYRRKIAPHSSSLLVLIASSMIYAFTENFILPFSHESTGAAAAREARRIAGSRHCRPARDRLAR